MSARSIKIILMLNPMFGMCDLLTGVVLLFAPNLILEILNTTVSDEAVVFVRYVGVFVFAVGLSYFLPYFCGGRICSRDERIFYTWLVTAAIRCCVATFVFFELCLGELGINWLIVAMTDAVLAAMQFYFVKQVKS